RRRLARRAMKIGAVFPQTEIGADVGAVRAFAEGVQELGFDHLLAYDHVLGADRATHTHLAGPYRTEHLFHEIMVLFGYVAGVAPGLELGTALDRRIGRACAAPRRPAGRRLLPPAPARGRLAADDGADARVGRGGRTRFRDIRRRPARAGRARHAGRLARRGRRVESPGR